MSYIIRWTCRFTTAQLHEKSQQQPGVVFQSTRDVVQKPLQPQALILQLLRDFVLLLCLQCLSSLTFCKFAMSVVQNFKLAIKVVHQHHVVLDTSSWLVRKDLVCCFVSFCFFFPASIATASRKLRVEYDKHDARSI